MGFTGIRPRQKGDKSLRPSAPFPVRRRFSAHEIAIATIWCLLVYLIPITQVQSANFFVSQSGSPSGDGSLTNAWDILTAFNQPAAVMPGDTIWLRGGIYEANTPYCLGFKPTLNGSSNAPIVVRQYPGERAILQQPSFYTNSVCTSQQAPNVLEVAGNNVWYWGIEIRGTNTTRVITVSGSNPPYTNLPLFTSVSVDGYNVKLINLVVHDTAGGFGLFAAATNCEASGCVIYNNGWDAPDRGHAHGIYCQNLNGLMQFDDNIIFGQFGFGIQGYTTSSTLKHFLVQRNVVFDNDCLDPRSTSGEQILFGSGSTPVQDLNLLSNCVYAPLSLSTTPLVLDYGGGSNDNLTVANNYAAAGTGTGNYLLTATSYQSVIFTNNTFYSPNGSMLVAQSMPGNNIDLNTYYENGGANFNDDITARIFSAWQSATGYDTHSIDITTSAPPNKVVVNANPYESKRANIVVYNWANSNNVSVDVSSILSSGDVYEVINAMDYFAPSVLTGIYNGATLSVPMTNLTVAVPNGWTNAAAVPVPAPQFAAFELIGTTPPMVTSTSILSNGSFQLQFKGAVSDNTYTVETSTDLVTWVSVGFPTNLPPGSAFYQYTDPNPGQPNRFYKIKSAY